MNQSNNSTPVGGEEIVNSTISPKGNVNQPSGMNLYQQNSMMNGITARNMQSLIKQYQKRKKKIDRIENNMNSDGVYIRFTVDPTKTKYEYQNHFRNRYYNKQWGILENEENSNHFDTIGSIKNTNKDFNDEVVMKGTLTSVFEDESSISTMLVGDGRRIECRFDNPDDDEDGDNDNDSDDGHAFSYRPNRKLRDNYKFESNKVNDLINQ